MLLCNWLLKSRVKQKVVPHPISLPLAACIWTWLHACFPIQILQVQSWRTSWPRCPLLRSNPRLQNSATTWRSMQSSSPQSASRKRPWSTKTKQIIARARYTHSSQTAALLNLFVSYHDLLVLFASSNQAVNRGGCSETYTDEWGWSKNKDGITKSRFWFLYCPHFICTLTITYKTL